MPCDQSRTIGVSLEKCDATLMHDALAEMGLAPRRHGSLIYFGRGESIDTATGKAQLSAGRDIASIKQGYSRQVVKATAKRYGWQVKETEQNKFQIIKR